MGAEPERRSTGFLIRYALANAGGVLAFLPLLTMLLPIKIEAIDPSARLDLLTIAAIAGAIAASLSNILFGILSDRAVAAGRTRRGWIAGGLAATVASYVVLALARDATGIVVAILLYQLALNSLLAPLYTLMADEIPDSQKGIAGGLGASAHPLASGMSAVLVISAGLGEAGRFAILCAAIVLCVAPLLATRGTVPAPASSPPALAERKRGDLARAWWARLFVQISGNVLFYYLLYYFEEVAHGAPLNAVAPRVAQGIATAYTLGAIIAVVAGRYSDRLQRRAPFVCASALLMAAGLLAMALASDWIPAMLGFGVYACGNACFLALHTALAMEVLPSPRHRGRDLGLVNLTNTLPAILGPAITWSLVSTSDFTLAFEVLAICCVASGIIVLGIRTERPATA